MIATFSKFCASWCLSLTHSTRCQYYDEDDRRNHYRLRLDESYDHEYAYAYLEGEPQEAREMEEAAERLGYLIPNTRCRHVANTSSQRLNCRMFLFRTLYIKAYAPLAFAHRDEHDALFQPLMDKMPCSVKFRRFDPLPEYRAECPYTLVIIRGEHEHPIPLSTKTPPQVRAMLMDMFYSLDEDLADLTVRGLLRCRTMRNFLRSVFPGNPVPQLCDIHPSLANRSHIRAYIKQAKDRAYPSGTGWKGRF